MPYRYYYNSQTKESVWVKPKELIEIENLAGTGGAPTAPPPAPTGAVSNGAVEQHVAAVPAAATAFPGQAPPATAASDTASASAMKGSSSGDSGSGIYATVEDAQEAFRQLLRDKKVSWDWKWDRARRIIVKDPRFNALPKEGDRKQVRSS